MKTPMQELIDHLEKWMLDDKHVQDNPMKYEEYMVQHANQMVSVKRDFVILCESLIDKEKETMVDFAYKCRNLMAADEFAISKWYDETFNTKEK